jgi:ectonucleotide pyrophosphatase/phosphodiesterase family member 5
VQLVGDGAVANLFPQPGREADVAAALLKSHPHMACHEKAGLPAGWHYGRHPRVAPIVCVAEIGWVILPRTPNKSLLMPPLAGMHGYDPEHPDMAASFVAAGPAFRSGVVVPPFDNVDVHPLLLRLLGLPAIATDGSETLARRALR